MRHAHLPDPNTPPSGQEPSLGGDAASRLTGSEPMLGGLRRADADFQRIHVLLNAASADDRRSALEAILRFGQVGPYARELVQVIPARARQKVGNWRGAFTPGQRLRAIEALGAIGSYESVGPLLDVLAERSYEIRSAVEKALGAICARLDPADPRTHHVYQAMTDALSILPLSGRSVVARILSSTPPDLVLGPLLRDGLAAGEWWARREAARALGLLGDRRATRRLMETLADESAAVRASAAWALGQLDAPVAIQSLTAVAQDADEVVRAAAVEALGAQTARLSVLDDRFKPTLAAVVAALRDEDVSVRHAALEALGAIQVPEARIALHAAMNRHPAD